MNELISVIIPIYGVEKYLDRCVRSVTEQTHKNLEIILVDDQSPDNCPAMCDRWAESDSRIKVIHKKNGGLSDARNAGMKIATGEYISFIDGDDFVHCEMLKTLLDVMLRDKSDISACDPQNFYEGEEPEQLPVTHPVKSKIYNTVQAQKELMLCSGIKQHVWNKLYRRRTIDGLYFDYGKCHEDVFWSYKAIGNAKSVSVINLELYYYLQRPTSIMGERYSKRRMDALEAMKLRGEYMKQRFPELYDLSQREYMKACMYHYQLIMNDREADKNKQMRKCIIKRAREISFNSACAGEEKMQRIWLRLFRTAPSLTCLTRNKLGIGK